MGTFRLSAVGRKKITGARMTKHMKERQENYNRDRVKEMREKLKEAFKEDERNKRGPV
jgi:hypothetical protein